MRLNSPHHFGRGIAALLALAMLGPAAPSARAADGLPICTQPFDQFTPVSAPDGEGGMYVAWLDKRHGFTTDVYLQRISPALQRVTGWPDGGVEMTYITCNKADLAMTAGNGGGVFATWSDNRCDVGVGYDIFVDHFTPQGSRAAGWPAQGRNVLATAGNQVRPVVSADGAGGAFVVWTDLVTSPARIVAQHVLPSGALDGAWPATGLVLATNVPDSATASVAADAANGVFVAWQDSRGPDSDIWMQHLQADGQPASGWAVGGAALVSTIGHQYAPRLVADGDGGVFAVWCDRRAGSSRLYARRVSANGAGVAGWLAGGNPVASGIGEQARAMLLGDGSGGAFIAWQDARSGIPAAFAQRLDGDGAVHASWPLSGIALAPNPAAQVLPVLASDGAGGVFASWLDARTSGTTGADVYATRIAGDGALAGGWSSAGTPICDASGEQRDLRLAAGEGGTAYLAWTDARATAIRGTDVAMASVGPQGPGATMVHSLEALHHDGQTFLTWHSPPGEGWKFRVFRADHPLATPADLATATLVGFVGDSSAYDRHFSQVLRAPYSYRIDSLAAPLDPAQGLYVHTCGANASAWYAVTSQNSVFGENLSVQPGVNALTNSVTEVLDLPRPVWQRNLTVGNVDPEIWTLFVPDRDTPLMPAMGNRPGLAYDCAIVRPLPHLDSSLLLPLHYRGGSLLDGVFGTGTGGEWVLGLDDWLPNGEGTFWYGYADSFDITQPVDAPTPRGTVVDYTIRRADFTIGWALRTFGIDTSRVYAFGYSMGGVGASMMALHLGNRFAAAMSVVGNVDLSFASDPDTNCYFNPRKPMRRLADAMWTPLAMNRPSSVGGLAYEQLNGGWIATHEPDRPIAPLQTFAGKLDITMGWAQNIGFWQAMQAGRRGGAFYWETRHHNEEYSSIWSPIQDPRMLYRFRTNQSFPAASNCSTDDDPGNGAASSGAGFGAINAYLEWDTFGVDSLMHWQRGLGLRSLTTFNGLRVPPDSCTMDLTLRRLQRFRVLPFETVTWEVRVISQGNRLAQSGIATADAAGLLTIPGVKVLKAGCTLDVVRHDVTGVSGAPAARPGIALSRHPARGRIELRITWPGTPAAGTSPAAARATLYDVGGRQVRALYSGPATPATRTITLDSGSLPPGLYLVAAEAGGARISKRMVVIR